MWYVSSARILPLGLTQCHNLFREGNGGEYPASSTSASEAVNEKMGTKRGPCKQLIIISCRILTFIFSWLPVFIMITDLPLVVSIVYSSMHAVVMFIIT